MAVVKAVHPILQLADQLGHRLSQIEEVQRFRAAEQQIEKSQSVQSYIELIKQKQKELVHAKHYQKGMHVQQVEQELDSLNEEFENLPIVQEYRQMQVGVNDMLQTIQDIIASTISQKLHVNTGGHVASGCGSGGACGCGNKKTS